MRETITLLHGDGISGEIETAAVALLDELGDFDYREGLIGGNAMDEYDGDPFPRETEDLVRDSKIVLLGAVGGPKWESTDPWATRPEEGLMKLRAVMGTHSNLRPVFSIDNLPNLSPLRPERTRGVNFMIVRELLGGSYFGDSGRDGDTAFDVREYSKHQVEAVGRTAFELARTRSAESGRTPHVTNVDKANVLETSRLWREVVTELHEAEYQDVDLDHMYVDNAAFQLLSDPRHFNVIVAENEHGDILSDEAALITGSLGLLPSASIDGQGRAIFEPVHGSAPDIAGKGEANPIAMFLSVAMMLDELGRPEQAHSVRWAVDGVLKRRIFTPDLGGEATTQDVTEIVIRDVHNFAARQ